MKGSLTKFMAFRTVSEVTSVFSGSSFDRNVLYVEDTIFVLYISGLFESKDTFSNGFKM